MVFVLSETLSGDLTYSEIIVGIVIALILVSLWQRAIENWLFETLGIDRKSTFQTLVVALGFTVIFFIFINVIGSVARDVVLGVSKTTAALSTTAGGNQSNKQVTGEAKECCETEDSEDSCNNKDIKSIDYVLLGDTRAHKGGRRKQRSGVSTGDYRITRIR